MRIQIRCASGLWLEFEGDLAELEAFDAFLSTLALVERRALEAPAASDEVAEPEPAVEYSPDHSSERSDPEPVPEPEPGRRARPTDKADAVVAAVDELGECTARDVARHLGRPDEYVAIGQMLKKLRALGLVGHNGRQTNAARYQPLGTSEGDIPAPEIAAPPIPADDLPAPVEGTAPPAAPIAVLPPPAEPAPEPLTDLEQRIVELVHRHGPVTALWIADQVLKHRRDVGLMMRELEGRGVLTDSGGGWYSLPGAEEAQAA